MPPQHLLPSASHLCISFSPPAFFLLQVVPTFYLSLLFLIFVPTPSLHYLIFFPHHFVFGSTLSLQLFTPFFFPPQHFLHSFNFLLLPSISTSLFSYFFLIPPTLCSFLSPPSSLHLCISLSPSPLHFSSLDQFL